MEEKQILVIIKEPGKFPYVEPMLDNTLEAMQETVGGYIETLTVGKDVVLICNEEGKLDGLPDNVTFAKQRLCGTFFIAGYKGDEFVSLKAAYVPALMRALEDAEIEERDD